MIKITDPDLSNFYAVKPEFDILAFDFTRRSNCQTLIDSLTNQNGDATPERAAPFDLESANATLDRLKTYQRLLRLEPNKFTAEALHQIGYHSAWQIASKSEAAFKRDFKQHLQEPLSEETAQRLYRKARGVKARTLHLWATVQNMVTSPHFRALRANNMPTDLVTYLSEIPGYDDLFGSLDYYEVEHCQSILSPAAYFVELMWYIDEYYTSQLQGAGDFTLDNRRPDLKKIELTCENSLDSVPFLHILNDILRQRIEEFGDVGEGNANSYFATAVYPWRAPFNLPLEQIRRYLTHLQAGLPEIYRTFGVGADVIGRAEAGLSVEMVNLLAAPDGDLQTYYGLNASDDPVTVLKNRDTFLKQSGLTRPQLVELLEQNLTAVEKGEEEIGGGTTVELGRNFYINQVLNSEVIKLEEVVDSTDETLTNLIPETLDRIHRFVRLAQVLDWSFADLDLALRAIGILPGTSKDIDTSALNTLGHLCTLQRRYQQPVDVLCALFADMNTIGIGDPKKPIALFERIYNLPSRLGGNQQPYRPKYDGNAFYIDTVLTWNEEGTTSNEEKFSAARLAASLGLSQTNLNALRQILWGSLDPINLDVHNLTLLYRFTVMTKLLDCRLEDYAALAELLEMDIASILEPKQNGVLEDFERLVEASDWLKEQGWTIAELDYLLRGKESKKVDTLIKQEDVLGLMEGFWAQNLPVISDQPDEEEIATLNEGLALYFGIDSELFPGLARLVAKITGIEDYLQLLYTPSYTFDTSSIVAYWPLNESKGTIAHDVMGNHVGEIQGNPIWETADDFPNGQRTVLRFSGTENVVVPYAPEIYPVPFTVSFWFKVSQTPEILYGLISNDAKGYGYQMNFGHSSQHGYVYVSLHGGYGYGLSTESDSVKYDQWNYITLTCGFGTDYSYILKLYLNGELVDSVDNSPLDVPSYGLLYIGSYPPGYNQDKPLDGYIADVCIWSEARTAEQVIWDMEHHTTEEIFLTHLSRYHLLATKIGLTGRELQNMADYPTQYNLPELSGTPDSPTQLAVSNVHTLSDFKALVRQFEDTEENELVIYLEGIGTETFLNQDKKIESLAAISGWSEDELSRLISSALSYSETDLDTAAGLARIDRAFDLIAAMGGSVAFVEQLIELGDQGADNPGWEKYQVAADAVAQVVQSKYVGEELDEVTRKLNDPLDEAQRDVMTDFLIWKLNQEWAGTGHSLENRQDLSEYLLVDVEMAGVSESTPIKQGQLSLQMYAQRCQLGLEEGIQPLDLDSSQWEWMLDYRMWEANRKIFLYPENYIEPELRTEKSVEFATLQNELQQGAVTDELVETAFRNYFDSFETLAKLQIVETARYKVKDPSRPNPIDTLFVFGKSATEPTTFYYRRCIDPALPKPVWQYWEPINLQINATTVMPAYAFSRLFLFWVEQKEITKPSSNDSEEVTEIQATIKYSFLNSHNKWAEPQTLVADYAILSTSDYQDNVLTAYQKLTIAKNEIVWQRPYALVVPVLEPDSEEETEQILVFLGKTPTEGLSSTYSWVLTGDLLSKPQQWTFRTDDLEVGSGPLGRMTDDNIKLSKGRRYLAGTTVGSLAIFAGGEGDGDSDAIDIYDLNSGQKIDHSLKLSEGRYELAGTTVGSLAIFAGGYRSSVDSDAIDIYDLNSLQKINHSLKLSEARYSLAGTTVGSLAIFAGGYRSSGYSDAIDIYDLNSGQKINHSLKLSEGRYDLAGTTVGSLAIFAGGRGSGGDSDAIDIYDLNSLQKINHSLKLSEGRYELAGTTVGSLAIFAGGYRSSGDSDAIDIYDLNSLQKINHSLKLSEGRYELAGTTVGSLAIFAGGEGDGVSDAIDIYDLNSLQKIDHSLKLSEGRYGLAGTTVGSLAIFAGGQGSSGYSDAIEIFYPLAPTSVIESNHLEVAIFANALFRNYNNNALTNTDTRILLESLPGSRCQIRSVKNQAGWSVLHYGQKAFLNQPVPSEYDYTETINEAIQINQTSKTLWSWSHTGGWYTSSPQKFQFTRLTTDVVYAFTRHLFTEGLDRLLSLKTQQETKEFDFNRFGLTEKVIPPTSDHLDFNSAYGPYFWEIFYHVPSLVANTLNTHQQFTEAQRWYQYIFNPTAPEDETLDNPNHRVWQFLPFQGHTLQTLEEILGDEQQLATSMGQPFDPHALAQLRIGAYEKVIVMKYIDNLLDWGDYYFTLDTWESINRAATLYFLANDILGPRPRNLGLKPAPEPKTYNTLNLGLPQSIAAIAQLEHFLPTAKTELASTDVFPLETIIDYFGVNENQDFVAYWERVEDRLYKIRNGMNIQGIERSLALYQPPIDPAQLVKAQAAGGGLVSFPAGSNVPHYRFDVILARARNMTADVIQLGATLLATLEKQDAEALARLQFNQQTILLQIITQTKEQQIAEAEANLASLQRSLEAAQYRQEYYQNLIAAGWSSNENTAMDQMTEAMDLRLSASIISETAAISYALPDIFGVAGGGMDFGAIVEVAARAMNIKADHLSGQANLATTTAQYQRREEDWELQEGMAQRDIAQIEAEIAAAEVSLEMANMDLEIHNKSIEQAQEIEAFYQSKFTNQELYQWMVSKLASAYYQCYQIALSLASQAQQAYQYELLTTDTYLQPNYWDSLHKGLLAGEQLMWGLNQLEKAYLDGNSRTFEIEKVISLRQLDETAFNTLKETKKCPFSLTKEKFDHDFPNHYGRQIKTIDLSIPAVVSPYQNINAMLSQTQNTVYTKPNGEGPRQNWRSQQQIAISRGVNDNGLFVLNFQDERYLPFEGTGAISDWVLELSENTPQNIIDSITDVIITLSYTAIQ
ncbi:MAG: hypothetical protein F6K21_11170 [Symploca sp. SIO2D2]|nr:hypothetical protein [Symploca sp. SIO2D2]